MIAFSGFPKDTTARSGNCGHRISNLTIAIRRFNVLSYAAELLCHNQIIQKSCSESSTRKIAVTQYPTLLSRNVARELIFTA